MQYCKKGIIHMKNVMKKLFSLLLVGVVAVSMCGFIAPNSVDAAEVKPSKGEIHLKQADWWSAFGTDGRYFVKFYNASGQLIGDKLASLRAVKEPSKDFPIPVETNSVVIEIKKGSPLVGDLDFRLVTCLKFTLDETSTDSIGSISLEGQGINTRASVAQSTTGCWKYAGTIAR